MPRRSRAELPRGGRDGCAETGLPWKSSLSSACAVTAPTVRGWGCGGDVAGGVSPAVGVPAAVLAGWRRHRAPQPEVGCVFVPGSIEPPWLGHAWPRARRARGAGARAGGGDGGAPLEGALRRGADGEGSLLARRRLRAARGCNALLRGDGGAPASLPVVILRCPPPGDHADGDGDGGSAPPGDAAGSQVLRMYL